MDTHLLTAAEVAKRLHAEPITVVRAIRAKKLRATKPGRTWLVSEADLAAYLEAHSNQGAA